MRDVVRGTTCPILKSFTHLNTERTRAAAALKVRLQLCGAVFLLFAFVRPHPEVLPELPRRERRRQVARGELLQELLPRIPQAV